MDLFNIKKFCIKVLEKIKGYDTKIGNTTMGTTATTLTGAIAEHEGDISNLNSNFLYIEFANIESANIAGNNDGQVVIPKPSGAKDIKMIIPIGSSPVDTWNTYLLFQITNNENRTINFSRF